MSSFCDVSLDLVVDSPWQSRKAFDEESIRELADSIGSSGLLQPAVMRKVGSTFELIAGHRRVRAHRLLRASTIPVHLVEATDQQARELVLVENAQREDIHPIDEALAIEELLKTSSVVEVAAKLGKTPAYVHGRMRLTALIEPIQAHLRAGVITLTLALRVARLDDAGQKDALKAITRHVSSSSYSEINVDPPPVDWDDVSREVSALLLPLAEAGFPLDQELAGAPACLKCPKRTGAQTTMFSDGIQEEDRCTDSGCFKAKAAAHWKEASKEHKKAGGTVLPKRATFKSAYRGEEPVVETSYGPPRLNHAAPFVDLDGEAYAGGKRRSWSKVLKELDPKEVVLATAGHRTLRLVPKAKAEAILKAKYPEPKHSPSATEKKRQAELKAERAKTKLARKVFTKVHELAAAASTGTLPCDAPIPISFSIMELAVEYMRGVDREQESIEQPAQRELLTLMVEQMGGYKKELTGRDRRLAELLGVDVGGIEASVMEAAKPKAKTKAPRKKKKPAAKRPQEKSHAG